MSLARITSQRSLALCGACGRDRDPANARCACDAPHEEWQPVGPAAPGAMIDTRVGSAFFGGLALLITLAIASTHALAVLCALLISPALAIVFFFGGRQWRTEAGAVATTFAGALVAAEGRGVVSLALPITAYPSLRGDHTAAALARVGAQPPGLGSDAAEVAVLAAVIGAASRGAIVLRARDGVRWTRAGWARRLLEPAHAPSTILVEPTERLAGEEDKLLHDLLGGLPATARSATYRDSAPLDEGAEAPPAAPLEGLLQGLPPLGDSAAFGARYAHPEIGETARDRQLSELRIAAADVALREPVRLLLAELRRGGPKRLRSALSTLR